MAPIATLTPPPFSASPLITPERLETSVAEALEASPAWAGWCAPADSGDSADSSTSVLALACEDGSHHKRTFYSVCIAILYELTRYGGGVKANANGKSKSGTARYYFKISLGDDNFTIRRLVMDARSNEAVHSLDDGSEDERPEALGLRGAGKPQKEARLSAMRCAETFARKALGEDDEVGVRRYLDNLDALFAYHDGLFGIKSLSDY